MGNHLDDWFTDPFPIEKVSMSSPDPHHVAGARGLVAVSLAGVLWGTTGVVVQYLHRTVGLGAISIGFWRLLIAAVAMVAISVPTFRRLLVALRHHKLGMIGAGIGLAFYQACYFLAVVWVGVAVATMVSLGVAPVVITVWESVRWRRWPPARRLGAVIMALAGLVLIQNGGQQAGGPHPGWGLMAALMSGTVYAATAVLSSRLTRTVPSTALTTVMVASGALALLPLAAVEGLTGTAPWTAATVGGLIFIGVACTAVAYGLFNAGLRTVPSGAASILTLWEPLTAAVLAVLLLGEILSPAALVGSALLLGSVMLSYLR